MKIHNIVMGLLEERPSLREAGKDKELYLAVCEKVCPAVCGMSFKTAMLGGKEYHMPSIESVGRARRKIQEEHEELRGTYKSTQIRVDEESKYESYARGETLI